MFASLLLAFHLTTHDNTFEVYASQEFKATPAEIAKVLEDPQNLKQYPYVVDVKFISPNTVHTTFMLKRDCVTLVQWSWNNNVYVHAWESTPNAIPVVPGIDRVQVNRGSWTVSPTDYGSLVEYRVVSEHPPLVPGFLRKSAIKGNLEKTLSILEKLVLQNR